MAQKFKKLTENRTQKFEAGFKLAGKFLGIDENEYIGKHLIFETEKEVVNVPFYTKIEQHESEIKKGNFYLFDNIRMEKTKEGQKFLNFDIFELAEDEYNDYIEAKRDIPDNTLEPEMDTEQ